MVKGQEYQEPEQQRKLFIGGLDFKTTDEGLKEYFEKYGDLVDVVVMKDSRTKKSRGFGFVAFSRAYMVDDAQKDRPHRIDGRTVETKRAVPRDELGKGDKARNVKKLFVGGFKADITRENIEEAFGKFGEIIAVTIPIERGTDKQRGFAFVEFDDFDGADKACLQNDIYVKGKKVEVKKALSKDEMSNRHQGGSGSREQEGRDFPQAWERGPSPWAGPNPAWENRWAGPAAPMGGNPAWASNQGPSWGFQGPSNDFGRNYNQNYGGGPSRGSSSSRLGPYNNSGGPGYGGSFRGRY